VRPLIIGVGGGHSGAGKTPVACLILRSFAGWGAIKYTKTRLYASIIDDPEVLSEEGKDTRKFIDAGAAKVLWVKSPNSELGEVLPVALGMLSHLQGIVVEGNSAIETATPDIVIFVCGADERMKNSAQKILQMADVVIARSHKPPGTPQRAILFEEKKGTELVRYLSGLIANYSKHIG
jgi:molybdopterin-guanine dinucleotide biosynthesis protein